LRIDHIDLRVLTELDPGKHVLGLEIISATLMPLVLGNTKLRQRRRPPPLDAG
jgi:hypothetical protein